VGSEGRNMTARFAFIPSIAGLRAIAVLLVVLNHYNTVFFTNWLIGDVGVAVFFSISGFLAYYVLQRDELKWGAVSYRYFMLRRILRIWPLYFVIIALTFFTEARLGNVQYPPWSLFTFTFNFDLAAGRHPGLPSLSILWSIAVEEQFYILAPLMYRAMRSRYCALFCVAIFIFANAARLLHLAYVPQPVGGGACII
jgi:peptidoglycan/LPS O-acetylase OafA/YrhL